jgi:YidC/Oxa1 family membrane protein insertase
MDKKFWFTVLLSITTVWIIQWYFARNVQQSNQPSGPVAVTSPQQGVPSQPTKVLSAQDFYRPLDTKIVFSQEQAPIELTTIQTPYIKATFSNQRGALVDLSFKEYKGRDGNLLRTVNDYGVATEQAKQKACFLLALDDKTPFIYKKITLVDGDDRNAKVTYQTETEQWVIEKTYIVHHNIYQLDVEVTVAPKFKDSKAIRMRLFVPAPVVKEITDDSVGIVSCDKAKNVIEKVELEKAEGLAWPWDVNNALFGTEDKYFTHTLVYDASQFVQRSYVKQVSGTSAKAGEVVPKEVYAILESGLITEKKSWTMSFYMGPKVPEHLVAVDDRLDDLMSFGWLSWLCKLLLKLLEYLFGFLGNYGLAILGLALVLRIPLIPLSVYSRRKMEIYQKFQPTIQKIRLKYRHDVKMQHEELMKFHQEHNLSTATPVLGCLPILIQLPILFALFRVLGNYLNLYNAPFYGWVTDLSTKDPYYVLPILMGASMMWQQWMTPTTDEKQRVIMLFMTLVFTVFFAKAAAGLVLYWLVNNIVTIGEDYLRKLVYRS